VRPSSSVGERGEEDAGTVQIGELDGCDGAAACGARPRLEGVHDLTRLGGVLDAGELDPFDVTDDSELS